MMMPESRGETISSGVTPTCCRYRTSFSAVCSSRYESISSKFLGWLLPMDCGEYSVPCEISEQFEAEISFRLLGLSGIYL
jgi:hypothetical protein